MKRLTLLRHAKSSWKDDALPDLDRPLSRRGRQDAPRMGRRLRERGFSPDALIASPAKRARATAKAVAQELGYPVEKILRDEAIYEADLTALLRLIRHLDEAWGHVMLVGHNPGLAELAGFLAGSPVERFPTCAVAELELDVETWSEAREACAALVLLDYPKRNS